MDVEKEMDLHGAERIFSILTGERTRWRSVWRLCIAFVWRWVLVDCHSYSYGSCLVSSMDKSELRMCWSHYAHFNFQHFPIRIQWITSKLRSISISTDLSPQLSTGNTSSTHVSYSDHFINLQNHARRTTAAVKKMLSAHRMTRPQLWLANARMASSLVDQELARESNASVRSSRNWMFSEIIHHSTSCRTLWWEQRWMWRECWMYIVSDDGGGYVYLQVWFRQRWSWNRNRSEVCG